MSDERYDIPLLEGIDEAERRWLLEHSSEVSLEPGEVFVRENDTERGFYITLDGELQISTRRFGPEVVLGTTPRGIIGGELALLLDVPSQVTARAIAPSRLLVLDARRFRELFAACPTLGARILQIASERMTNLAVNTTQQEKMAALGKFAAGLAHELNNPAAATTRAAHNLLDLLPGLQVRTVRLNALGLDEGQMARLAEFQQRALDPDSAPTLTPMARSDREDEVGAWLDDFDGLDDPWTMAETFVSAGVGVDELRALAAHFDAGTVAPVVRWLYEILAVASFLDVIEQGSRRISELVAAIKEYTFMDQGPVQAVDIHRGLDTTLKVLNHKLRNVQVVRQYDSALPTVMGRGSELNQVWTNLIDNAIDAMDGSGTLTLITRCESPFIMVEVTDSGRGIPSDVLPRIFEPFYTTKDVGKGTGLGLDTSYRIVRGHQGTIEVQSQPGHTRFIVRLPMQGE